MELLSNVQYYFLDTNLILSCNTWKSIQCTQLGVLINPDNYSLGFTWKPYVERECSERSRNFSPRSVDFCPEFGLEIISATQSRRYREIRLIRNSKNSRARKNRDCYVRLTNARFSFVCSASTWRVFEIYRGNNRQRDGTEHRLLEKFPAFL